MKTPLKVKLGDGYEVDGIGSGTVALTSQLPSGKHKLHNVLHIPSMSYNLLSVPAVTEHGKTVQFEGTTCQILDECKLAYWYWYQVCMRNYFILTVTKLLSVPIQCDRH